ncbi:MAG: sulfotransferase [Paracoccaceae bacterium]
MLVLSPAQIDATFRQAMSDLSNRKFDDALRGFRQVSAADPGHADALYQTGRILIAGDRPQKALTTLRAATEIRPQEVAFWQVLAEAVALGGSAEDEKSFLAALKKAPIAVPVKLPLQERFGALRSSSRPMTGGMRPNDMRGLTMLMSSGDFAKAEAAATALLKAHPKSAFAANVLASAQTAQKKYAAAGASFQQAIRLDPKYSEAYENLGRMLLEMGKPVDAAGALRKAVILAPGRVSALTLLGEALGTINETQAALPLLLRAREEEPDSIQVHVSLGNAYARLNDHQDAEASFSRAVELSPDNASVEYRAALGIAQSRLGRDREALENLDKVLAVKPDHPLALSGKAGVLQTLGQFDEAMAMFRRATEVDPLNGENYRQLIVSHKTKPGDKILADMVELYDGAQLSDNARMNIAFAIAKALEDTKDYDNVFRYLDNANALMRKAHPYRIVKRFREVKAVQEAFASFDYHGARIEGANDFAPIFVTGMPRSGTTLIEQIISSHSTVTGGGELGMVSSGSNQLLFPKGKPRKLADIPVPELRQFGDDYRSYILERFPDAERITDKSIPTYMYIGMIKLALPNARFVVVRRDPRDNLLSIYKNKFPDGTHPYAYDQRDLAQYYGTFVSMLDFWRERVPDWFYEVQYEKLVSNPEEETRKLIAACGLDWEDACLSFHENTRKVQTLSVYQVRQPISKGSVQAWQRYEAELKPMLDILKEAGHVAG